MSQTSPHHGAAADSAEPEAFDPGVPDTDSIGANARSPLPARRALVSVLNNRFITVGTHPELWRNLVLHQEFVTSRLRDLFLELVIDDHYGVAHTRPTGEDGSINLIRRDRQLSRETTFVLIFLRREYAFGDGSDEAVVITRDQVVDFLEPLLPQHETDQTTTETAAKTAITNIEQLGLLHCEDDTTGTYTVSPAIMALVTPDTLKQWTVVFNAAAQGATRQHTQSGAVADDLDAADPAQPDPAQLDPAQAEAEAGDADPGDAVNDDLEADDPAATVRIRRGSPLHTAAVDPPPTDGPHDPATTPSGQPATDGADTVIDLSTLGMEPLALDDRTADVE